MLKKIISTILIISMILTLSVALFSCKKDKDGKDDPKEENPGNDDNQQTGDGKTKYTVTVVDADGNPINGVEITFHFEGGADMPFTTDATGMVSQNLSKKVKVSVSKLPDGYTYGKLMVQQSFDADGNLTVTLEKEEEEAPLVILVVDQHGNPVEGVSVQACDSLGCRMPTTTDSEGKAYYPYEETDLRAQLSSPLLGGYTVEDMSTHYDFVDGVAKIVITKAE